MGPSWAILDSKPRRCRCYNIWSLGAVLNLKFCGAGPQAQFRTISQYATLLQAGRGPEFVTVTTSDFMATVKERFQYFCRAQLAASSGGTPKELVGRDAANHIFDQVSKNDNDVSHVITLQDSGPLQKFEWLFSPESQAVVRGWVDAIFGQGHRGGAGAGSAKTKRTTTTPQKNADKVKHADLVSSMFD